MNIPIEPELIPKDTGRQLSSVDTSSGFPSPANPTADIGEQVAIDRALEIASNRYKATNSEILKSSLMSYEEAQKQLLESTETEDPLFNPLVWVIKISGSFQRRGRSSFQGEVQPPIPTFTKAYVVLRAADGLVLATKAVK